MAVTGKYRNNEVQYPESGYNGLAGVSNYTAQKAQQAQQGYQPNEQAQQAQAQLQNVQNSKPQSYNSKYSAALDNILQQIQNPKEFKYSFNGDELFKYYADLYTQKGKQASMDVMGQAAALTGGYGNSYAQQAGQQAYDQYLLSLYDKGMDLHDRAYQKYKDDQQNLLNQYDMLSQKDKDEYSRYRDTVSDWENERNYLTQQEAEAYNRGYNEFMNDRNYWTQQAAAENADYWTAREMEENARQYDTSMDENRRQYDTSMAENKRQYDTSMAENRRQYDTSLAEQIRQYDKDFDENQRQYDTSMAENQRQYDTSLAEQIREYNANLAENKRQFDANLAEQVRQFDASLNWDKMSSDQKYAAEYALAILQNGEMPTLEMLQAAGLSEEDAEKLRAKLEVTASGGGTGGKKGTTYYTDIAGNYYVKDKSGQYVKVDDKDIDWRNDREYGDVQNISNTTASVAVNTAWKAGANNQKKAEEKAEEKKKAEEEKKKSQQKKAAANTIKKALSGSTLKWGN